MDQSLSKIYNEIDNITQELLIPLRTSKTINRAAFDKLYELLDELKNITEKDEYIPINIVGLLFLIYVSVSNEGQHTRFPDPIYIEAGKIESHLDEIFRNSSAAVMFYGKNEKYGCFSNFSEHGFELDGKYWPTSEHYFQANKFLDIALQEIIRSEGSPMDAARIGRDRSKPLRQDWEEVKDEVMKRAVFAKFSTHSDIRSVLTRIRIW